MRVSELEGALLDYWVARAEGLKMPEDWNQADHILILGSDGSAHLWSPSQVWGHGGPIIEREGIDLEYHKELVIDKEEIWWEAYYRDGDSCRISMGKTALIAAMRAYVGLRFGDEVPDMEGQG